MTQNKVMKLWTAVVTAFLALCTTLGLITTTAAAASAAVPQAAAAGNTEAVAATQAVAPWAPVLNRALPPTMKQRIRAEAHGSSPSCRHRAPAEEDAADGAALTEAGSTAEPPCSEPAALTGPVADPMAPELTASLPLQR
ncbi:DUF6344 domain-containing protein [Streptomyces sp. NPDC048566]|uniref:DUF6344 domain-containing protein n=1 Tax=Streptomyces sp. NPDC048566 TaxID=3365569 RepID=UPI0037137D78